MSTTENKCVQLEALSREHDDGRVFVQRVRDGIDKVSSARLVDYTRWYWKNHIRPHFYQEEKILLPYFPKDHPLSTRMQDEHAYIRDLIVSLDQEADSPTLKILCDLLDRHIAFEEDEVFPFLANTLPDSSLNQIVDMIKDHPVSPEECSVKFW